MATSREEEYEKRMLKSGAWITDEFIEETLRLNFSNEINLIEKKVSPAVGEGNNFLSLMYRIKVKYSNGEKEEVKSLIVKTFPEIGIIQDLLEDLGAFEREILMYKEVLPKMKSIMKEYIRSDFVGATPYKCNKNRTLVMDDLLVEGYKMVDRKYQLDFDHCAVALKSLARYHALSLVLKKRQPEIVKNKLFSEIFTEASADKFIEKSSREYRYLGQILLGRPGFEKLGEAITVYSENSFRNNLRNAAEKCTETIDVLSHGDVWITNMLFKYNDKGHPVHAKLVDYQLSRLESPVFDLIYFFFTSPKPEVITKRMNELIEVYYNALSWDFRVFNIDEKLFTLDALHAAMRKKCAYALTLFIIILPKVMLVGDDVVLYDERDRNVEDSLDAIFKKDSLREKYEVYLKHFEKLGWVEGLYDFLNNAA